VIIGTLMLILVVVIGVTAIALMMSTATKDEMNRQAHINSVKNENLVINHINLVNSSTDQNMWQYVNFDITNLDINDATVTTIGLSNDITKGYRYPANLSANLFGSPNPAALYSLSQAGMYINPSASDSSPSFLRIPGKKSLSVSINLSNFTDPQPVIKKGDEIRIQLYTLNTNNFEKRFIPPTPVVKVSIATEDLGVKRDYLVLDGSGSTSEGSIVEYRWVINQTGQSYPYKVGKIVVFKPNSTGEMNVNLTITDNNGMQITSDVVRIPANNQFFPPVKITIIPNATWVDASVFDLNNVGVSNVVVKFISDGVSVNPPSTTTDTNGFTTTNTTGHGVIHAEAVDYNLRSLSISL
jgi:hypothetical protein